MSVDSLSFFMFVAVAALFYNIASSLVWRQIVFFLVNLWFLSSFSRQPEAFLPLVIFLLVGYAIICLLQAGSRSRVLWPFIVGIILAFIWLKKYTFLAPIGFLQISYTTVGLSFIFFRLVHIVVDTRDGMLQKPVSPLNYLNYMLNFATLTAGPIQRYQEYAADHLTAANPPLTPAMIGRGLGRIALGMFQSVLLGTLMMAVHERAAASLAGANTLASQMASTLVLFASYTLFLYFNFSGYTDIVIGVARLFRLNLPENFDYPFLAGNFLEFWGRWHMTLSDWFKTYVYNPLMKSLMIRFPSRSTEPFLGVVAFFVTFFLIGLWHGQTSIFILCGLMLGFGVSVNKLYQVEMTKRLGRRDYRALTNWVPYRAFCQGLTFSWISLCLGCFWADWNLLGEFLAKLGLGTAVAIFFVLAIVAGLCIAVIEKALQRGARLKVQLGTIIEGMNVGSIWKEDAIWISCGVLVTVSLLLALISSSNALGTTFVYTNF